MPESNKDKFPNRDEDVQPELTTGSRLWLQTSFNHIQSSIEALRESLHAFEKDVKTYFESSDKRLRKMRIK